MRSHAQEIGTFGTIVVVGTIVRVGTALFSLLFLAEGLHILALVSQLLESQAQIDTNKNPAEE